MSGQCESTIGTFRSRSRDYSLRISQSTFELGEALGQMDFERAAKLPGSRFVVLKKGLAKLERRSGSSWLDLIRRYGYTEIARADGT